MAKIEIYTSTTCSYCITAKELLRKKGVYWTEIDITDDFEKLKQMMQKANGRRTVPQIFIDNKHIGGCDDLIALDKTGVLTQLLAS